MRARLGILVGAGALALAGVAGFLGWERLRARSGRPAVASVMDAPSPATSGLGFFRALAALAIAVVVAIVIGGAIYLAQQRDALRTRASLVAGGDPDRGVAAAQRYGCGGCHTIPGVPGATGLTGPPLSQFAERAYIAGELRNTPDNLVAWIKAPREVEAHTAMPDMGVSERDAHDLAALLYTEK